MAARRDIAALGELWNPTILWYARAVDALAQPGSIRKRTSWYYLAAIHGISDAGDGDPEAWIRRGLIEADEPLPSAAERRDVWDQCQHDGWYFLPWHRGYLWSFEAIVARTVRDLGGPADWALPYWNYFDASNPNARRIPPAFLEAALPDGTPNPLARPPRNADPDLGSITLSAMRERRFRGGQAGFGGDGDAVFEHFGQATGRLESNPHNGVHRVIGGYMGDPNYAGLDPIFWLHHCNVDRLWAAWLTRSGNVQENGPAWADGPADRPFSLPDETGDLRTFRPADTLPGGALAPEYDDLTIGTGAPTVVADVEGGTAMPASFSSDPPPKPTLLGSSTHVVTVGAQAETASIKLAPQAATTAASPVPTRLFVTLRNVRGTAPTGALTVSVGAPATADHAAVAPVSVETVSLFGLAKASHPHGPHAGNGLGVSVEITEAAREVMARTQTGLDELDIEVRQPDPDGDISVGTITVVSLPEE